MNTRILRSTVAFLGTVLLHVTPFAAEQSSGFDLKLVADGLVCPTSMAAVPGSGGALLVTDQAGTIHVIGKDGKLSEELFLDVRERLVKLNQGFDERGLLGLALHPDFTKNDKFYIAYSAPKREGAPADWDHTMKISEFKVKKGETLWADPASERLILEIDQPYFNHNGGCIVFGPDGFLYISVGDGGNANDQGKRPPTGNGQDTSTLLGKILRIDVNKGQPYAVPQDNPFVGKDGKPEIYAYGFRNPWRMSFDRGGERQFFAADVGQDAYEELDIVVKGGNYGWNIREGFECFDPKNPTKAPEDCPKVGANGEPLIDPILAYKNFKAHRRDPDAKGISITGGFVYRGKAIPQWQGKYIFADWSKNWAVPLGVLFIASPSGDGKQWNMETIAPASHPDGLKAYIGALGEDAEGELYVMTSNSNSVVGKTGKVYKLVRAETN